MYLEYFFGILYVREGGVVGVGGGREMGFELIVVKYFIFEIF